MSGYLNNPPRTILIESDNRPGSYPTLTSPVDAARSPEFNKPFRDTITMETPVVYGRSSVNFSDVPSSSDYIEIDNANGVTNKFVFSNAPSTFVISSNTYSVDMSGVRSSVGNADLGLNAKQVSINNAARRFIIAVNLATGSFITAAPGTRTSEVILTQNIPGAVGNTSNTSSTVKVTISNFTGGNDTYVRYPYGVHVSDGNAEMSEVIRRVISTSRSGTLDVPTSGDARLVEGYAEQHGFGSFSPFDESNSHQSFGVSTGGSELYGTQTKIYDQFFTRGSISGTFDTPLSIKDKIVISLPVTQNTRLQYSSSEGENFPMAYYNFLSGTWERIGFGSKLSGKSYQQIPDIYAGFSPGSGISVDLSKNYEVTFFNDELRLKFSGSLSSKKIFKAGSWMSQIDTFGFPFHPKYHATSSQALEVSNLIDRPFLVEKFIYEFSARSSEVTDFSSDKYTSPAASFFILNQRKSNPGVDQEALYSAYLASGSTEYSPPDDGSTSIVNIPYLNSQVPQVIQLSINGPQVYVDSTRDLVTFSRVGTVWKDYDTDLVSLLEEGFPHPAKFMDLAIQNGLGTGIDGSFKICDIIKSPSYVPAISSFELSGSESVYLTRETSTRNGINTPTGRAYGPEFVGSKKDVRFAYPNSLTASFIVSADSVASPYILMPGDKLIFGWQSALSEDYLASAPDLTLMSGSSKIILYGSYLRDGKPVHNIYKDQLNSDAAHEAIPSGPSVLDRFETDPQMMFSGSMREEHITGTMLTRNSDGSLSVTDVNDFSTGGVRAVSARVSDGDVKQRWSFFRNTRLVDSEEQYYDSMQPDPLKVLTLNSNIGERFNSGPHLGIMIPGTSYRDGGSYDTFINSSFNKKWIGSFPFEIQYAGISRLKHIDRNALSRSRITTFNGPPGLEEEIVGIVFATGSVSSDATPVSNLLAPGGLTEYGLDTTKSHIFPNISIDDTESFTSTSYLDDNIANPAQERRSLQNFPIMYQFSRFMGCFGAGYLQIVQFKELQATDLDYLYLRGMLYRGVKHGLINPIPLFSNAVFNGTAYGQFRDMMEQRQYTRFSLGNNTLTESAVEVFFINRSAAPGTLNITSGSATNSSNISKNATSEHPYDDALSDYDQIWDRDTALPESLISL